MASLQSISTFSFKHHLTGEAWPACRAILLFIQTPLDHDRRGMASEQGNLGMVSVYRTYVHSYKNRHLNIVLQAELFLRTGTYDRPKNTVPVQDTVIRLDPPSPEKTPSPGDRRLYPRIASYQLPNMGTGQGRGKVS